MTNRFWWSAILLLFASTGAAAQSPSGNGGAAPAPQLIPRTSAERDQQYAALHRILLNVQVTDSSGNPAQGLTAADFIVRVDGIPQKVNLFRAVREDANGDNTHAVLVIDTLNDSAHDLASARKQIEHFVHSAAGPLPLPVTLAVLTDVGIQTGTPTRDREALLAAVTRATSGVHPVDCTEDWNNAAIGLQTTMPSVADSTVDNRAAVAGKIATCLNDKYRTSVMALRDFAEQQVDVPGRAILIWTGPGWPLLYGPAFVPDTPQLRQSYFANLVELSTSLREAQVTLDSVSWPSYSPVTRLNAADLPALFRGTPDSAHASAESLALPVVAHLSGGQVFLNQKSLANALSACLTDASSYYVLAFQSAPSKSADELRTIDVAVDRPGLTVRTIPAYYAQP